MVIIHIRNCNFILLYYYIREKQRKEDNLRLWNVSYHQKMRECKPVRYLSLLSNIVDVKIRDGVIWNSLYCNFARINTSQCILWLLIRWEPYRMSSWTLSQRKIFTILMIRLYRRIVLTCLVFTNLVTVNNLALTMDKALMHKRVYYLHNITCY